MYLRGNGKNWIMHKNYELIQLKGTILSEEITLKIALCLEEYPQK
jgi:hypothetical protein